MERYKKYKQIITLDICHNSNYWKLSEVIEVINKAIVNGATHLTACNSYDDDIEIVICKEQLESDIDFEKRKKRIIESELKMLKKLKQKYEI